MSLAIDDLRTPCLLLDEHRMNRNIAQVGDKARALDVRLRPHFKTPKSLPILQKMMAAGAGRGVTVSTLREAEYLALAGYTDLLLTTPLSPRRTGAAADLARSGVELTLVIDSVEAAIALAETGLDLRVLVELNVDDYRGGLPLHSEEFQRTLDVATRSKGMRICGVLVYPGASSRLRSASERRALGEKHRTAANAAADAINAAGWDCAIRSFGSTSVLMAMDRLDGITEHRGGVFVFQDLHQAGLGWCARDDIALTVAATVVSHDQKRNRLTIDAGGLALSKDRSTAGTEFEAKYGWLVDPRSGVPIGDLWVEQVFQEHGLVTTAGGGPIPFERVPVGTVIAVQLNHADMTAAAYDRYHLVRDGTVVDLIHRVNGW